MEHKSKNQFTEVKYCIGYFDEETKKVNRLFKKNWIESLNSNPDIRKIVGSFIPYEFFNLDEAKDIVIKLNNERKEDDKVLSVFEQSAVYSFKEIN